MTRLPLRSTAAVLALGTAVLSTACSNDPVAPTSKPANSGYMVSYGVKNVPTAGPSKSGYMVSYGQKDQTSVGPSKSGYMVSYGIVDGQ